MTEAIAGIYLDHTCDRGFIYRYQCPRYKLFFTDTAPELSAPTLCSRCYHGEGHPAVITRSRKPARRLRRNMTEGD